MPQPTPSRATVALTAEADAGRLTPRMRETITAPRGRCPDGSRFAGRYLVHANARTLRALVTAGLAERVWTGPVPEVDAYALTEAGERLRATLRAR